MVEQLDLFDNPLFLQVKSDCSKQEFGFCALPAGYRNNNGDFNNLGNNANFWSASENDSDNAYNRNLNYNDEDFNENWNNKKNAYSVRLVRDSENFDLAALLYKAYLQARKNKRNTFNQLEFEKNLESEILQLRNELESRTYELSPSLCFINEQPVKREIVAAAFRDRVVHHLIYDWLYPIFDGQFIYDCYSCRQGKGTLFGIERAEHFAYAASKSFTKQCYVLRLDISGFFMGINRTKLYELVLYGLQKAKWRGVSDVDLCIFLLKKIVFNEPLKNAKLIGFPEAWHNLPKNKSLMNANVGCGLPIGNLTSQLFGNVYLNPLDHYVKRTLKIRYYGRYVDDMVLFHCDKNILLNAIQQIREFLKVHLGLQLHPNKIYLQKIDKGFPFLGAYVLPWRKYPGRRITQNFINCLNKTRVPDGLFNARITSYRGMLKHLDAFRLTRYLCFNRNCCS